MKRNKNSCGRSCKTLKGFKQKKEYHFYFDNFKKKYFSFVILHTGSFTVVAVVLLLPVVPLIFLVPLLPVVPLIFLVPLLPVVHLIFLVLLLPVVPLIFLFHLVQFLYPSPCSPVPLVQSLQSSPSSIAPVVSSYIVPHSLQLHVVTVIFVVHVDPQSIPSSPCTP